MRGGMQADERRYIEVQAYRSELMLKYRNKRQNSLLFSPPGLFVEICSLTFHGSLV